MRCILDAIDRSASLCMDVDMIMQTGSSHDQDWTPFAAEYVLGDVACWREAGLRTALVTLVNIEGTTPRPLGAQMAVADDGRFTGYLSGGCLEEAVAAEACQAISAGVNRLVRYGRGSRYVDIKLPCGSGLDLYFDCSLDGRVIDEAMSLRARRTPFVLETSLSSGVTEIVACNAVPESVMTGDVFRRAYFPELQLLLVGSGPLLAPLVHLFNAAGLKLCVASPSDRTRAEIEDLGCSCQPLTDLASLSLPGLDRWTGAVLAFHEHDRETTLLAQLLATDCFYIGALGGKVAQAARTAALMGLGFRDHDLARVRGPIGLISGAKSRGLIAAGVVAEVLHEAKTQGLLV